MGQLPGLFDRMLEELVEYACRCGSFELFREVFEVRSRRAAAVKVWNASMLWVSEHEGVGHHGADASVGRARVLVGGDEEVEFVEDALGCGALALNHQALVRDHLQKGVVGASFCRIKLELFHDAQQRREGCVEATYAKVRLGRR